MTRANENARLQPGADTSGNYITKDTAGRGIRQCAKRIIVGAACWGLLPVPMADWIIRRLHVEAA